MIFVMLLKKELHPQQDSGYIDQLVLKQDVIEQKIINALSASFI